MCEAWIQLGTDCMSSLQGMMGGVGKEGVRPMVGLVLEAQVTVLTCNRGSGGLGVWGMGRGLPGLGAAC